MTCKFLMRARRFILPTLLGLNVALLLTAWPSLALAQEKFKDFKLETLDGKKVTLADYANKATLVSFFFPTCPYCNASIPHVEKIHQQYKDKGLTVVWVNVVPYEARKLPKWIQDHQVTIPILKGASQASLQRDYKLKMTPTHYLLDKNANILFTSAGYEEGSEKEMEQKVRAALELPPL